MNKITHADIAISECNNMLVFALSRCTGLAIDLAVAQQRIRELEAEIKKKMKEDKEPAQ